MEERRLFQRFPTLTNDDLLLHKIRTIDFNEFYELCSNEHLYQYRLTQAITNRSVAYNLITHYERDFAKQKAICFGIFLRQEQTHLIGLIEIYHIDKTGDTVTIGYTINEKYQNQGHATRAIHTTLDFLFHNILVNRVQAYVLSENTSSTQVLLKNGFSYEGTIREGMYLPSKGYFNMDLYSKLSKEHK